MKRGILTRVTGLEDGPGLTCPESRLADGTLRGECMGRSGAAGSQGEEA